MSTYDWGAYLGSYEYEQNMRLAEAENARIKREKEAGTYAPERVGLELSAVETQELLTILARPGRPSDLYARLKKAYADAR